MNIFILFAAAEDAKRQFEIGAIVSINLEDDGMRTLCDVREVDGNQYFRSMEYSKDFNVKEVVGKFCEVLEFAKEASGIDYDFDLSSNLAQSKGFQRILLELYKNKHIVAPALREGGKSIKIRPKCKIEGCGIVDKSGKKTNIKDEGKKLVIDSHCYEHGDYSVVLFEDGDKSSTGFNVSCNENAIAWVIRYGENYPCSCYPYVWCRV